MERSGEKAKSRPYGIFRLIVIILNNLIGAITYLVWMLLFLPLAYVNPEWYWELEGWYFNMLMAMCASWIYSCGHKIEELGDDISALYDDEVLVMPNHVSVADTGLLMYAFQRNGKVTNRIMWIMYIIFKYANFGWVSMVHGDFFISMGKETLVFLEKHLKSTYKRLDRKWIVLFPEGTFLRKGKASSQSFAKKNGYPILENVSLPRMGAVQTILDTLNVNNPVNVLKEKKIKYVVDVTIGYPHDEPLDMFNIIFDTMPSPRTVAFLYRVFPISEVPLQPDRLQEWMFKLYVEKNDMLEQFYKTGEFPDYKTSVGAIRMKKRRLLTYNALFLIAVQFLLFLSLYVQFLSFRCAISFIM